MSEYALIMLNMLNYACIYLNKQSSEYTVFLNVSDAGHSKKPLYKLLSSYQVSGVEHYQTFNTEPFGKRLIPECRCVTRNLSW